MWTNPNVHQPRESNCIPNTNNSNTALIYPFSSMAISQRKSNPGSGTHDGDDEHADDDNDKRSKEPTEHDRTHRRILGLIACAVLVAVTLVAHESRSDLEVTGQSRSKDSSESNEDAYELYPFLVDAHAATNAKDVQNVVSTVTLPDFPTIDRLEGCRLEYQPPEPPRTNPEEWRTPFWIPSFPGSGASNPTHRGNLVRELLEGLFRGDDANYNKNPVKDYHMSIKKKLKRCKGVSETIGCTSSHPLTPVGPETQTDHFRPQAIVAVRNPATAIPAFFAYKNMAYHKATQQAPEPDWRTGRDQYFAGVLDQWFETLEFWRGDGDSYYSTAVYVPFEDLLTPDPVRGQATVRALADAVAGRIPTDTGGSFPVSDSPRDHECLWYRAATAEWERQKTIVGDYVPAYTESQRDAMVDRLEAYADRVAAPPNNPQDAVLVALLRRYARQIRAYARVEAAATAGNAASQR